jgi:phosphomannomutase
VTDLGEIAAAMARLRVTPPTALGGLAVEKAEDLSVGSDALPPTDGLRYYLAEGARVIVRPSGTEPKLKCYLEVVVPVADGDVASARAAAAATLAAMKTDFSAAAGI